MIKATVLVRGGRTLFVIGLTRADTAKLHADIPKTIELHKTDPRLPELEILLCAGETEEAIAAALRKAFPVHGEPAPEGG